MINKENKGASGAPKVPIDEKALKHYNIIPANSFIHDLVFNPEFRNLHCIDCRHHKPQYICQKCKAERHDGYVDITTSGSYMGRFALDGQ